MERLSLDEKSFRGCTTRDAMATDKLAEGHPALRRRRAQARELIVSLAAAAPAPAVPQQLAGRRAPGRPRTQD